jgi:hypothetical protein
LEKGLLKAQGAFELRQELIRGFANHARDIQINGITVPCVNVPANFSSDVGEYLYTQNKAPFVVLWCASPKEVFVSLRSSKDGGENVEVVASLFGGGGHASAAGFSLKISELDAFLSGNIKHKYAIYNNAQVVKDLFDRQTSWVDVAQATDDSFGDEHLAKSYLIEISKQPSSESVKIITQRQADKLVSQRG